MAPQPIDYDVISVRAVTQRISSTPSWQLHRVAPVLARTICENGLLTASPNTRSRSDVSVMLHRLKTQISTLLQDTSPQARWTAVILANAIIMSGGLEALQGADAWVRSLLSILAKHNPPITRKLCILTLANIFLLTQGHPSLVREMTTPNLSAFITATLKTLSSNEHAHLSLVAVQSLSQLLPNHPSSFRPFMSQIRVCILPLIAMTPSNRNREQSKDQFYVLEELANSSRRLYVLLSTCASKKLENEEWVRSLNLVIRAIHTTVDLVFRALIEDRDMALHEVQKAVQAPAEMLRSALEDQLGLPGWTGVEAGIERLKGLLQVLKAFVTTTAHFPVTVPLSVILRVVRRILSILSPTNLGLSSDCINAEIGRDEREALLNGLPEIHATAVGVLSCLTKCLGLGGTSLYATMLQQCLWVLNVHIANVGVRAEVYSFLKPVLLLYGLSLPLHFKEGLSDCISLACEDILPSKTLSNDKPNTSHKMELNGKSRGSGHGDLRGQHSRGDPIVRKARENAAELLQTALRNVPDDYLANALRAQMDRTAILMQQEGALLASVLNPSDVVPGGPGSKTVMPFVARAFPESIGTEALRNPRMPVIENKSNDVEISPYNTITSDLQGSNYAEIHSGNGTTNGSHEAERRSFIPDSMQSERQLPQPSFASHFTQSTVSRDNDTQKTEISLVEVPETQPMTVIPSNKRDYEAATVVGGPLQPKDTVQAQETYSEEAPSTKRPRIDNVEESPFQGARNTRSLGGNDDLNEKVMAPSGPITVPMESAKPVQVAEEASDSDDSSIHIDPTLATDDEDDDDDVEEDV